MACMGRHAGLEHMLGFLAEGSIPAHPHKGLKHGVCIYWKAHRGWLCAFLFFRKTSYRKCLISICPVFHSPRVPHSKSVPQNSVHCISVPGLCVSQHHHWGWGQGAGTESGTLSPSCPSLILGLLIQGHNSLIICGRKGNHQCIQL